MRRSLQTKMKNEFERGVRVQKNHGPTAVSLRKGSQIYASIENGPAIFKKSSLRKTLMHANEVILHGKWRTTWGIS